jgi:DNA-binding MltR family transcriptional regulator
MQETADEWLERIHEQFRSESDRAAAIVVAAMLDGALAVLLRKRLLEPESKERSLLDGGHAPLGTFATRIDAAYQLGLISSYMARDLHLVRKIRNDFAHDPLHLTFESESVRNRVRALEEGSDYNRRYPETRVAVGPPGTRWDFLGITAWMLYGRLRCGRSVASAVVAFSSCGTRIRVTPNEPGAVPCGETRSATR